MNPVQQINGARHRARQYGVENTLTLDEWLEVREASGGRCCYCGERFDLDDLTLEHIIPMSKDGPNTKENVAPACAQCNRMRGNYYDAGIRFCVKVPADGWKVELTDIFGRQYFKQTVIHPKDDERCLKVQLKKRPSGEIEIYFAQVTWKSWADSCGSIYVVPPREIELILES